MLPWGIAALSGIALAGLASSSDDDAGAVVSGSQSGGLVPAGGSGWPPSLVSPVRSSPPLSDSAHSARLKKK